MPDPRDPPPSWMVPGAKAVCVQTNWCNNTSELLPFPVFMQTYTLGEFSVHPFFHWSGVHLVEDPNPKGVCTVYDTRTGVCNFAPVQKIKDESETNAKTKELA